MGARTSHSYPPVGRPCLSKGSGSGFEIFCGGEWIVVVVDGHNSFDASVFVLRLDTGSTNQAVFFLEFFEGVGIFGVVAFVTAPR